MEHPLMLGPMRDLAPLAAIKAIETRHCLVSLPVIAQLALLESTYLHVRLLHPAGITANRTSVHGLLDSVYRYFVHTKQTPFHQSQDNAAQIIDAHVIVHCLVELADAKYLVHFSKPTLAILDSHNHVNAAFTYE
jgi:hypothetical protein